MKLLGLVLIASCGGNKVEATEQEDMSTKPDPVAKTAPVADLCVTKGAAAIGAQIADATMRAIARGSSGEAASLTFTYRGETEGMNQLASGQLRRQLGLKLRAQDGCNLVYVMWRLDPKPKLDVSVKLNPGMKTHKECGASGYAKVKPARAEPVPPLEPGATHTLRAEIAGDALHVWIDNALAWRGALPAAARELRGPAGIRSDNLAFELVAFEAPAGDATAKPPKCVAEDSD